MTKYKHTMFKRGLIIGTALFLGIVTPAHAAYQYKLKVWNYTNEKISYFAQSAGCSDLKNEDRRWLIQPGKSRTILFNRADRCNGKQGQMEVQVLYWNNNPKGGQPFFGGDGAFYFDFSNGGEITLTSKNKQSKFKSTFSVNKGTKGEEICGYDKGCKGEDGKLFLRLYHKRS